MSNEQGQFEWFTRTDNKKHLWHLVKGTERFNYSWGKGLARYGYCGRGGYEKNSIFQTGGVPQRGEICRSCIERASELGKYVQEAP